MKRASYIILFYCLFIGQAINLSADNRAVSLDGKDNNVRTGIGILPPPWTLEAWVKGNDTVWAEQEVIIGGGEYSDINWVDNLPLVVRQGKVHSHRAGLWGSKVLDDGWHHVAVSCDGTRTSLYVDGILEDRADTATAVLPGAIGVRETEPCFHGLIDEVRVWKSAVPAEELRQWMGKPLSREHPAFESLWAYYPLDDFDGETALNWVGKGHQAYHVRNGRSDYYGKAMLACPVPAANPHFKGYEGKQRLFNAVVISNEWDAGQGCKDAQMLKLRIIVQGKEDALRLDALELDLSGTTVLEDIERVHVYEAGAKARSTYRRELVPGGCVPRRHMRLDFPEQVRLKEGVNYFLVTFDVKPDAAVGNTLHASVPSVRLQGRQLEPETAESMVRPQVTQNSLDNPDVVKVLQWNIWHGGNHVGNHGQQRVLETVRATRADVIMMQEAYGIQRMLADSLGYRLRTYSPEDNLALYSRFPFEEIDWRQPFNSNPVRMTLANGREVLFADCWLRYAHRPEYTSGYANRGLDPAQWVLEDSLLALEDIRNILDQDVYPNLKEKGMPVILTGDFNSCSHLDWTERAKVLHHGYGPVPFPVSRYMYAQGFKDSFREMHPDEVQWQCGTVSAIWGQMQMSRIDFIYYRGDGLKPLSSKVVRTAPEIDDVWPSDHAAVLTVFEVED